MYERIEASPSLDYGGGHAARCITGGQFCWNRGERGFVEVAAPDGSRNTSNVGAFIKEGLRDVRPQTSPGSVIMTTLPCNRIASSYSPRDVGCIVRGDERED